jgi:GT2 family glycosyltransferase
MTVSAGCVVIGRNEGRRLERALAAATGTGVPVVYVDSGSTDGSLAIAARHPVEIVRLSSDRPFTAARARNAGFAALMKNRPGLVFAMFIDGDCEIVPDFLDRAADFLQAHPDYAVAAGRVRELDRAASIYNRLCDFEWSGPAGDIDVCGGIFMIRTDVFVQVNGFNEALIAAEDDDLCIRVGETGKKLRRLDADMCRHDAGMTTFAQWWRRAVRAGHAYAQTGALHPGHFDAERRRAWIWGGVLPAASLAAAPFTAGASLVAGAAIYAASFVRLRMKIASSGADRRDAGLYAGFLTLSKFPNLAGILSYRLKRAFKRDISIVEYK